MLALTSDEQEHTPCLLLYESYVCTFDVLSEPRFLLIVSI